MSSKSPSPNLAKARRSHCRIVGSWDEVGEVIPSSVQERSSEKKSETGGLIPTTIKYEMWLGGGMEG